MNTDHDNWHGEAGREANLPPREVDLAGAKRGLSERARHYDPSVVSAAAGEAAHHSNRGQVAWVRPSELLAQVGSRVAGRGIDFHAELARRARKLPVVATTTIRRAISARARRLPPASAFGNTGAPPRSAARSSVGLR